MKKYLFSFFILFAPILYCLADDDKENDAPRTPVRILGEKCKTPPQELAANATAKQSRLMLDAADQMTPCSTPPSSPARAFVTLTTPSKGRTTLRAFLPPFSPSPQRTARKPLTPRQIQGINEQDTIAQARHTETAQKQEQKHLDGIAQLEASQAALLQREKKALQVILQEIFKHKRPGNKLDTIQSPCSHKKFTKEVLGQISIGQGAHFHRLVRFEGRTVLQAPTLFDLDDIDGMGRTNRMRMSQGLAPLDQFFKEPVELHHLAQRDGDDYPIAEVTGFMHRCYHGSLHLFEGKTKLRRPKISRPDFNKWRTAYWKQRLQQCEQSFKSDAPIKIVMEGSHADQARNLPLTG